LTLAADVRLDVSKAPREKHRRRLFRFNPRLKLMTTVDQCDGTLVVHTKGALEAVIECCTMIRRGGKDAPLCAADRDEVVRVMNSYARSGLRVLAMACRTFPESADMPSERDDAERELCVAGLAAMLDPPRPEVPAAIEQVHHAGIRVHVVTGDNGLTAAAVAKNVGIGAEGMQVVSGAELDAMTEAPARRVAHQQRRGGLRPQLARGETAHRRLPSRYGPGRRDDR
jgi:magnesium-transporting ATPase (P-type)